MNKIVGWVLVTFMLAMLFGAWRASEVDKAKGQPATVQMQNLIDNAKTDNNILNKELSNEIDKAKEAITKMDSILGGKLKGAGKYFYKYGTQNNVNPKLLTAIAIHETANGRELTGNNVGGIYNGNKLRTYASVEDGIKDMARRIKANYIDYGLTSIQAIGQAYAPEGADNDKGGINRHWIPNVTKYYQMMG